MRRLKFDRPPFINGIRFLELRSQRIHDRLCLSGRAVGLDACRDGDASRRALQLGAEHKHWPPELSIVVKEVKTLRHNTDDGVWLAIETYDFINDVRRTRESALPEIVADQQYRCGSVD